MSGWLKLLTLQWHSLTGFSICTGVMVDTAFIIAAGATVGTILARSLPDQLQKPAFQISLAFVLFIFFSWITILAASLAIALFNYMLISIGEISDLSLLWANDHKRCLHPKLNIDQ
jgi:hypothetical protein